MVEAISLADDYSNISSVKWLQHEHQSPGSECWLTFRATVFWLSGNEVLSNCWV